MTRAVDIEGRGVRVNRRSVGVGSAIPDSAVLQLDAQSAFGGVSDGTGVSTWPDELDGGYDATGSGPVVAQNAINGNVAVQFDGVDDFLNNTSLTVSQPTTIFYVWEYTGDGSDNPRIFDSETFDNTNDGVGDHGHRLNYFGDTTIESDSSQIAGNATPQNTPKLTTGVFDGANSVLREEGTQTASGTIGALGLNGYQVGSALDRRFETFFFLGYIGEIIVCDARLSQSEIDEQEQRLGDKWGITI